MSVSHLVLSKSVRFILNYGDVGLDMWFLCTKARKPEFYGEDGRLINQPIDWTHEAIRSGKRVVSSEPMIQDPEKAAKDLLKAGAAGFKTKQFAKEFAKTLQPGSWRYYQVK